MQLEQIRKELANLLKIIEAKDSEAMKAFLHEVRKKIIKN
jgi:prephenate dehydrogenase